MYMGYFTALGDRCGTFYQNFKNTVSVEQITKFKLTSHIKNRDITTCHTVTWGTIHYAFQRRLKQRQ